LNNKIYIILIIAGILYLVSCTSNTIIKQPKDLIPQDEMVNLLTDMYLANAAFSVKNKNLQRKIDYIPLVYEKYQIDSLRFHNSNLYYMSRIDDYEVIYNEVHQRLKEIDSIAEAAKNYEDSLKVVKSKSKRIKTKKKKN